MSDRSEIADDTWADRYGYAAERCARLAREEHNDLVKQALIDAGHGFRKQEAEHLAREKAAGEQAA